MKPSAGGQARLLVIKPGSLGDVVHALPVAEGLKRWKAGSRLAWVIDTRWAAILDGNPHVDEVIRFPREDFRGAAGLLRALAWGAGLRRIEPDLCVDLQGLLRSALIARSCRARRVVGLSDAREGAGWFHGARAAVVPGEHSVLRYLRVLDTLGAPRPPAIQFPLPQGLLAATAPPAPFVLVNPTARGQGKSLTPETLEALCRALHPRQVVLVGGAAAKSALPGVCDLRGRTTLPELIGLLRAAACLVSVDSAPVHIAAAIGVPLLAIHTWSDPRLVGPFSEDAWIWQGGTIRRQSLAKNAPTLPPCGPGEADAFEMAAWALDHSA